MCAHIPRLQLATRVALVMHHRERSKTTATGPLALACLPNSELHVHGLSHAPLDLRHLHDQGRRVMLLFPAEDAPPLSRALVEQDSRPITLVVPDGNWGQARRIPRRVPGLPEAECVRVPFGPPSGWGVRFEPVESGLATFEAIARALGVLESATVQERLEALFSRLVRTTLAARGADKAGVLRTSVLAALLLMSCTPAPPSGTVSEPTPAASGAETQEARPSMTDDTDARALTPAGGEPWIQAD